MRIADKRAAKARVQQWLQEQYRFANEVPAIAEEKTIERDFGWVFFLKPPPRPSTKPVAGSKKADYPTVAINRDDAAITVNPAGLPFQARS